MPTSLVRSLVLFTALLVVTAPALTQKPGALEDWRRQRAVSLTTPDGWFSLVGLEWLQDGKTTVGSAPDNKVRVQHAPAHLAAFTQQDGVVRVDIAPRQNGVLLNGQPATAATLKTDNPGAESVALTAGPVRITVIRRGDRSYLRIKDAQAPGLLAFHGLHWYAPNPHLRVTATWVPTPGHAPLHIQNVLGQVTDEPTPGYAEFTIEGKTVRLLPVVEGDALFFDFRDGTSRTTTYGSGRFLVTARPSNGIDKPGTVTLDFNYAYNPPCAYSAFATCPLPTAENRLQVSIPAGEQRYHE